jgi:hypothetical protein
MATSSMKKYRNLLWLLAVIACSALALSLIDRFEESRVPPVPDIKRTALAILVGYAGENFPGSDSDAYKKVGCEDSLVTYEIPVVSTRLSSVLNALAVFDPPEGLHNPMKEKKLAVVSVEETPRGMPLVRLSGKPLLGGICDTPRLKGQIEETIRLYHDSFEIRLNGSEEEYLCMGDVLGKCS